MICGPSSVRLKAGHCRPKRVADYLRKPFSLALLRGPGRTRQHHCDEFGLSIGAGGAHDALDVGSHGLYPDAEALRNSLRIVTLHQCPQDSGFARRQAEELRLRRPPRVLGVDGSGIAAGLLGRR